MKELEIVNGKKFFSSGSSAVSIQYRHPLADLGRNHVCASAHSWHQFSGEFASNFLR